MLKRIPYDRHAAVAYAHKWAFGRNPAYYDYEEIEKTIQNLEDLKKAATKS